MSLIKPVNADSAFLETDAPDDGVQFFAGQIPEAELARQHGQIGLRTPRPAPGAAEEQLSPSSSFPGSRLSSSQTCSPSRR